MKFDDRLEEDTSLEISKGMVSCFSLSRYGFIYNS